MGRFALTRRDAILAGAGTALAGSILPAASAAAPELDLEDPSVRARVRAKVSGSAAEETVYRFYRLHLYAYMHDGNLIPLFTMNNLNVTQCRPLENDQYAFKVFECGVYCKFDTDEVLETWENPITGEVREPWTFLGGPLNVKMGADGVETPPEATVHPDTLRMETYGGMVFVPVASHFPIPAPSTRKSGRRNRPAAPTTGIPCSFTPPGWRTWPIRTSITRRPSASSRTW